MSKRLVLCSLNPLAPEGTTWSVVTFCKFLDALLVQHLQGFIAPKSSYDPLAIYPKASVATVQLYYRRESEGKYVKTIILKDAKVQRIS